MTIQYNPERALDAVNNVIDVSEVATILARAEETRPADMRATSEPNVVEIKHLQDRTKEIARLALIGWSSEAIADFLGISRETVKQIRGSSLFRKHVDELQERRDESAIDVRRDMDLLIPHAIDTYERVLAGEEGTPSLRVKVAGEVLDRTGYAPVKQVNVHSTTTKMTLEDIAEIRRRAEDSRKAREAIQVNASPVDA